MKRMPVHDLKVVAKTFNPTYLFYRIIQAVYFSITISPQEFPMATSTAKSTLPIFLITT
jgi:hypothetical protein